MSHIEAMFDYDDGTERLNELLPRIDERVARILERALEGREIARDEGLILSEVTGDELAALAVTADLMRQAKVGDRVTYVVCRNINFTNVCYVGCKFCAFHTGPNKPGSWDNSLDEVADKAEEAWNRGATEICMQGGLPRGMTPYYYRDLLQAIRSRVPGIHIHAYSPMEITYGVELTGLPLDEYLRMLREAGLDSVPGTAAEILDDEVRMVLSKNKVSTEQWLRVIRTAHEVGIFTTSTMMYGHRENGSHWVNHMLLLRDIQKETGGFTEFVPLGFVHENTALFQQGLARPGPTGGRGHPGPRAGAGAVERHHSQRPGVLGEDGTAHVAALSQVRRQRLRRHAHGGEHLAVGGLHRGADDLAPRVPLIDPPDQSRACGTVHRLLDSQDVGGRARSSRE